MVLEADRDVPRRPVWNGTASVRQTAPAGRARRWTDCGEAPGSGASPQQRLAGMAQSRRLELRRAGPVPAALSAGVWLVLARWSSGRSSGQPPPRSQDNYRSVGPPPFLGDAHQSTSGRAGRSLCRAPPRDGRPPTLVVRTGGTGGDLGVGPSTSESSGAPDSCSSTRPVAWLRPDPGTGRSNGPIPAVAGRRLEGREAQPGDQEVVSWRLPADESTFPYRPWSRSVPSWRSASWPWSAAPCWAGAGRAPYSHPGRHRRADPRQPAAAGPGRLPDRRPGGGRPDRRSAAQDELHALHGAPRRGPVRTGSAGGLRVPRRGPTPTPPPTARSTSRPTWPKAGQRSGGFEAAGEREVALRLRRPDRPLRPRVDGLEGDRPLHRPAPDPGPAARQLRGAGPQAR